MQHIATYSSTIDATTLITKYFKGKEDLFSEIVTFENVKWEANLLNEVESILPNNLFSDIHFDLILNKGKSAVSHYYKDLNSGKNRVLELAKHKLSKDKIKRLNESAKYFNNTIKSHISSILNEQAIPLANNPELSGLSSEFDSIISNKEINPTANSSTEGLLVSLGNALTEGGSTIGIIHLILDIVGIIGDFVFPGAGAIADILNACIYFYRAAQPNAPKGMLLLGTISLIAGVIFGAGDILKLFKPAVIPMEMVMLETVKGGGKAGAEALSKVPVKEQSLVIKGLRYIAKNISQAFSKANSILARFFDTFLAKVVGWVPFIGKPLKLFFQKIGSLFGKFSDDAGKFSKEFATVEESAIKIEVKNANAALEKMYSTGGKMEYDSSTKIVKILDGSGTEIGKFSEELLTNPKIWNTKAPGLFKVGKGDDVVKYYNSIGSTNKIIGPTITKYLVKFSGVAAKTTGRLIFFIGKQAIKLVTGKDWQEAGYKKEEVEYWGNSALSSWINKEIKDRKKEVDATYIPAIELDSSDKDVYTNITNYQNNYAKLFGQPQIIPVIYNKFGNDDTAKEFDSFWSDVAKGDVELNDNGTFRKSPKKEKETNESVSSLKYILPYSLF